jgi:hypothetical protein
MPQGSTSAAGKASAADPVVNLLNPPGSHRVSVDDHPGDEVFQAPAGLARS